MWQELLDALKLAVGREDALAAVREVYGELEEEISSRGTGCAGCGKCCHFEEYGHRLYITTIELAVFLRQVGDRSTVHGWEGRGCPFQAGCACSVHPSRPMGCRIFFCDTQTRAWQQELYERWHGRLRTMHKTMGIPYLYVSFPAAIAGLSDPAA